MIKKFFIFLFIVFISSCNNTNRINNYKEKKLSELNAYVNNINYRDYDYENWIKINELITNFEDKIKLQNRINLIDEEYNNAIYEINNTSKTNLKSRQINYNKILFEGHIMGVNNADYGRIIKIINNQDELIKFFSNYRIEYDGFQNHNILDKFNKDYFMEKSLIIYINGFTGSNINRFVDDLYINGDSVILHLQCKLESYAVNDDFFYLPFLIEVENDELNGINNMHVIEQWIVR